MADDKKLRRPTKYLQDLLGQQAAEQGTWHVGRNRNGKLQPFRSFDGSCPAEVICVSGPFLEIEGAQAWIAGME